MNVTYVGFLVATVPFSLPHDSMCPRVYETYGGFILLLCHFALMLECHNKNHMTFNGKFDANSSHWMMMMQSSYFRWRAHSRKHFFSMKMRMIKTIDLWNYFVFGPLDLTTHNFVMSWANCLFTMEIGLYTCNTANAVPLKYAFLFVFQWKLLSVFFIKLFLSRKPQERLALGCQWQTGRISPNC